MKLVQGHKTVETKILFLQVEENPFTLVDLEAGDFSFDENVVELTFENEITMVDKFRNAVRALLAGISIGIGGVVFDTEPAVEAFEHYSPTSRIICSRSFLPILETAF